MATLRDRTIKNSAYSFLAYAVPFLFTFFLTPLIIHRLGVEQYALFVLVSVITGFFGLFKFGLGWGVVNVVGRYHDTASSEQVSKFISSTLVVMLGIGTIGCGLSVLVGTFGASAFNVTAEQRPEVALIFIFAGIGFIFSSLTSVFANILSGAQRQDLYARIYLTGLFLMNVLMLFAASFHFGVAVLVGIQLLANIIMCCLFYVVSRRILPLIRINFRFSKEHFMPALGFNAYAYIHEAASTLLFELDKVLIAAIAGPTSLAFYSIPGTLSQKIQGTVGSLTNIFFPVAARLLATNEKERIRSIYQRVIGLSSILTVGLAVSLLVVGQPLLEYWLGESFAAMSLTPLYILTATHILLALYTTATYFAIGLGDVKNIALTTIVMLFLNVGLLFILLPRYGINGAAWAYALSMLPVPFVLYRIESRYLNIGNIIGRYSSLWLKLLGVGTGTYLLGTLLLTPHLNSLLLTILGGALVGFFFLVLYRALGFLSTDDANLLTDLMMKFFDPARRGFLRAALAVSYPLLARLLDSASFRQRLYAASGGFVPFRGLLVAAIERRSRDLQAQGEAMWGPRCGVLYDLKHNLYGNRKKREVYVNHYARTLDRVRALMDNTPCAAIVDYGSGPGVLTRHLRDAVPAATKVLGFGLDDESLEGNRALAPAIVWQRIETFDAWLAGQPERSVCLMLDGVLAAMTIEKTEELLAASQVKAIIAYYSNPLQFDVAALARRFGWQVDEREYPPTVEGGPSATSAVYIRSSV